MPENIIFDPQMTTYDMAALESIVEELKPKWALEIGSWKGLSSSIIARHSEKLFCVDTWKGEGWAPMEQEANEADVFGMFRHNISALGLVNKVYPLVMTSEEAQNLVRRNCFDFIYIDGNHTYDHVLNDLSWFEYLKRGGVLAGHDFDDDHPGVKEAVSGSIWTQGFKVKEKSSVWYVRKE